MICDMLTGKEIKTNKNIKSTSFIDNKGVKYKVCSSAYGEVRAMEFDEYIKRCFNI